MSDLTEFLLARIAEDEAVAREVQHYTPDHGVIEIHLSRRDGDETRSKIVRPYHPARVLAEVEAKRRIVELHSGEDFPTTRPGLHLCEDSMISPEDCDTMRALASVYSDHPAFNEAWRV